MSCGIFCNHKNRLLSHRIGVIKNFGFSVVNGPPTPKNFSKNDFSLSMTPCFLTALFLPPKRDTGGISLSISVPVVLISPSRNAFSRNFLVSGSFSFSSLIIWSSKLNHLFFIENTGRPHSIILLSSYGSPHQYVFGYIVETPLLAQVFFVMSP